MELTEVFEKLKNLQSVLIRRNELETEMLEAPNLLKTHEELLAQLKQEYIEKNANFETTRSEMNAMKGQLFEVDKRRENAEKNMESVETQRDYELLEKAIKDARAEEESLRIDLQQITNKFNRINDEIKKDEEVIAENEAEIEEMKSSLDEKTKSMTDEIKSLEKQKIELSEGLEPETIFKFERIIKNKLGDGIVPVKSGVCTGCNMILPAQFANEIQSETELRYCPYCSRVLYYELSDIELEEADDFSFDDADIGGLADLEDI
ncbi:MAG: C4-type zinc ribbon domain-containing protein [Treponemataceae bacterium]